MNSMSLLLLPRPSTKLSTVRASAATAPSIAFASISPPQRKSPAKKHSVKPAEPISPVSPTTISTATTTPPTEDGNSPIPLKKVLVPIGFGTEEMEAVILVDVLRRAGADVTVASVEPQLEVEAAGGTKLVADTSISACSDEIFDLVALPGGMPGSARLRDCDILRKITCKQAEEKRLYGAICAAPAVTLLPWGLLRKKKITCHPAFMDKLSTFWAVKSNLQVSEELTTSRGPGTSFEFALSLVDQLYGESVAKEISAFLLMSSADDNTAKKEFNEVEWSVGRHTPQVLLPIANGSEVIEIVTIADILRRAKANVVVASVEKNLQILASQGTKIIADISISDAQNSPYDLIILPGGIAGAERLSKSRVLKKLLKEQNSSGRIYGAVCSSPEILHKQGLLKDKRATAHPSVLNKLKDEAVTGARVVIDGKLITSEGFATVTDFAFAIVTKLFGNARARSVAEGLVFEYPRS
ncbi:hypothetical protein L6164_032018 [Bauhinia variegata]|uniref:Uncharacterized protein n=1 Tax=Bauhinia variegata TaxID=167791 RepID=A0ACB9KMG2_BAUVA|nr:hypothetical protein L6164_032018 [Bauhinia variegata]